ncbi:hypothetical protein Purlil1_1976 [Purpureocillium lilacinum]|uniref:Uncharacterized protein n=1 Tax=Purpureocillium lilacinum TaxID=33203 RepID=A0ABR0CBW0_PURLI|nr:hypothetical protein Purlil1_1976 [Purpureocillium lilacinum]
MKESFGVLIYASKAACVDVYTYVVGPSIPHQSRRFSHATHPPLIPHTTALHAPRRSSSSPIVIVIIIAEQTFVPRNGQNPPSLGALALATRVWWMDGWMPGSPPARPTKDCESTTCMQVDGVSMSQAPGSHAEKLEENNWSDTPGVAWLGGRSAAQRARAGRPGWLMRGCGVGRRAPGTWNKGNGRGGEGGRDPWHRGDSNTPARGLLPSGQHAKHVCSPVCITNERASDEYPKRARHRACPGSAPTTSFLNDDAPPMPNHRAEVHGRGVDKWRQLQKNGDPSESQRAYLRRKAHSTHVLRSTHTLTHTHAWTGVAASQIACDPLAGGACRPSSRFQVGVPIPEAVAEQRRGMGAADAHASSSSSSSLGADLPSCFVGGSLGGMYAGGVCVFSSRRPPPRQLEGGSWGLAGGCNTCKCQAPPRPHGTATPREACSTEVWVLMRSRAGPLELAGVERCGSEFAAGGHPGFSGVRCRLSTTVGPEGGGGFPARAAGIAPNGIRVRARRRVRNPPVRPPASSCLPS